MMIFVCQCLPPSSLEPQSYFKAVTKPASGTSTRTSWYRVKTSLDFACLPHPTPMTSCLRSVTKMTTSRSSSLINSTTPHVINRLISATEDYSSLARRISSKILNLYANCQAAITILLFVLPLCVINSSSFKLSAARSEKLGLQCVWLPSIIFFRQIPPLVIYLLLLLLRE